jgi:hypothetical protein
MKLFCIHRKREEIGREYKGRTLTPEIRKSYNIWKITYECKDCNKIFKRSRIG